MGKYSENPIDNIQGYLNNIEMVLARMEAQQKEHAAAPSQSADNSELESMKDELSSIRTAIDEILKDNGLVSASMKTVAEAIGTVPTEEERKRQHQEDLQYVIDNTRKHVTVDLDSSTKAQLNNISGGISNFENAVKNAGESVGKQIDQKANKLSEPLDRIASDFEKRIGRVVEKKAEQASNDITSSMVENWFWRTIALVSLIAFCLTWLFPKIREIDFPNGAEGFFYTVVGIIIIIFILYGIYRLGKMNGHSYY